MYLINCSHSLNHSKAIIRRLYFHLITQSFQQFLIENKQHLLFSQTLFYFTSNPGSNKKKSLLNFSHFGPFPRACKSEMFLWRLASQQNCLATHSVLTKISKANWKLYWNAFSPYRENRSCWVAIFNLFVIIKEAIRCEMKAYT